VRDALAQAPGEVIRLALLMTHYRDPLDWTEDKLRLAKQTLDRFYRALSQFAVESDTEAPATSPVLEALDDDLNTPQAITYMHEIADRIFQGHEDRFPLQRQLSASGDLLGLLGDHPLHRLHRGVDARLVEQRLGERAEARRERRFGDADKIRAELLAKGIVLEDRPDGTTDWRRA
jgi:cysteinyl-tRNA synthetase